MPAGPGASQPEAGGGGDPPIRVSACPTLREQPVADPAVPRMELRDWAERYGVVAGITTRGSGRGFSLGLWSEENVGQVMTRWRALRAAFQPAFPAVVLSHQIHGTAVQWHRAGRPRGVRLALVQRPRSGALLLASRVGRAGRADDRVPGRPSLTRAVPGLDSGPVQRAKFGPHFFLCSPTVSSNHFGLSWLPWASNWPTSVSAARKLGRSFKCASNGRRRMSRGG